MRNYQNLISRIQDRYNPESNYQVKMRAFSGLAGVDLDLAKYVRLAMMEVDEFYTQKTIEAGERVKSHLQTSLNQSVEFRYQGSVMTQTHIRAVSDIDLLTITGKFNGTALFEINDIVKNNSGCCSYIEMQNLQNWLNRFSHYGSSGLSDLKQLREECEGILLRHYSICDITKPKAIKIKNQNLNRDVDIVISNWYEGVEYAKGLGSEFKGIELYNKATELKEGPDYPFLSISLINAKSTRTNGRLKRMIRFLKNVRTDSDKTIPLTSFDINAVCYDIPEYEYENAHYLDLVRVLWLKLYFLTQDAKKIDSLKSVNGKEYVFKGKSDKINALKTLEGEVRQIYNNLPK